MSTYFVNASGTNTSPFDTPAKGATNFGSICTAIGTFADSDIIEVVNDGLIDDSAASFKIQIPINEFITVRSYGTDGTNRLTSKPTIKIKNDASFEIFATGSCAGCKVTVQNLKIYKDENQGGLSGTILYARGNGGGVMKNCIIEGCEIYSILTDDVSRVNGICVINTNASYMSYAFNNIVYNTANGFYSGQSGMKIFNNTIFDFTARGIDMLMPYMANNIVHGNNRPGVVGISGTDSPTLVDYNDIYGCPGGAYAIGSPGAHDIFVDPLFVNASGGNFKLQSSSPCINTGAGTSIDADIPVIDFDGISRPQGSDWDRGAYEYEIIPTCWNFTAKFKNSNRLFKMNGSGLFPKELRVPKNLDLRTARMIDEGRLIDPSQFQLL